MKHSKFLLVEDNRDAAAIAITILEYVQHVVVHKMTGEAAVQAAQTEFFDGILLDYLLPDMDGLEVCRQIRRFSKDVPIILTTAFIGNVTQETMDEAGVTAFVPKPLSQNLIKTLDKYVMTRSLEKMWEPQSLMKMFLGSFYEEPSL